MRQAIWRSKWVYSHAAHTILFFLKSYLLLCQDRNAKAVDGNTVPYGIVTFKTLQVGGEVIFYDDPTAPPVSDSIPEMTFLLLKLTFQISTIFPICTIWTPSKTYNQMSHLAIFRATTLGCHPPSMKIDNTKLGWLLGLECRMRRWLYHPPPKSQNDITTNGHYFLVIICIITVYSVSWVLEDWRVKTRRQ